MSEPTWKFWHYRTLGQVFASGLVAVAGGMLGGSLLMSLIFGWL